VDELALHFFPYPHVFRGERRDGAAAEWHGPCLTCDRQCETSRSRDLELCSYGFNYKRVDDDLLIACVVVRDYPATTPALRKRIRQVGTGSIHRQELERAVQLCGVATSELESKLRAEMDSVVAEFRDSKGYQQEMVELLRPDLERTLTQVHDYKQFVQQIVQNMNVILESRYPGMPLDEKLDKATHEETAIYWAAILMDEKLDAALFLEASERIHEPREQGRTRLHGLVLKYIRIYKSRADRKNLTVSVVGDSWGKVQGNVRALGIIPHTLIDNALKYAPQGSRITLAFEERDDEILFSVESYGPEIEADERPRVFDLFFRAKAARQMSSEGTGFGLASAQNIAKAHSTEITLDQSDKQGAENTFLTTFSVRFEVASQTAAAHQADLRIRH